MKRFVMLVGRALRRCCPYCGVRGIFSTWWTLRSECPSCGVRFEREEGYFLGAYALNLIFAEFLGLGAVVALMVLTDLALLPLEIIGVALMVGLPVFLYPYARTLWMALDLQFHPPNVRSAR